MSSIKARWISSRTATEATKADGGALGMRLVSIGEWDAHREERNVGAREAKKAKMTRRR